MPELPGVNGYQNYIKQSCLNQNTVSLDCRDARLLKKPFQDFKETLINNNIKSTKRIEKYLFLTLKNDQILLIHFGTTRRPNYYFVKEARPKFGHMVIGFENGYYFLLKISETWKMRLN